MSEQRQKCCRLCLAPDSECISILNSYAADKEPLTTKIYNCVHIKINSTDRLSLRICHACISYLNSWQSFKNRCISSQNKQLIWLDNEKQQQHDISIGAAGQQEQTSSGATTTANNDEPNEQHQQQSDLATSILDGITSLKKRKSLTVYPLPAVQIKDEPYDSDEIDGRSQHQNQMQQSQDDCDDMVDPTMFLERTEEEGDEPLDGSVYGYASQQQKPLTTLPSSTPASASSLLLTRTNQPSPLTNPLKKASCRACNLKFSTRANARRHERTLHPNLFELSTSTPHNTPITKPTADFAALLATHGDSGPLVPVPSSAAKLLQSSSAKFRPQAVNTFVKRESIYDYDSPEKYQHLLTDEKIIFLQQNEEFLHQYQTMTCRCCNKFYTTYKNFMAHMRKKYATLPRNLCFNCLKLNDSKALFISHLKRRNCINLFKILHALMERNTDFAAAVKATAASVPEKLRAKDLLVNKMYECKLCPKQFRLKLEFRTHVYDEHSEAQQRDAGPNACSFCATEIDDPIQRKHHHNNMECIVTLRCMTCEAKFDNHQKFIDHVYEKHLANIEETGTKHLNLSLPPLPLNSSSADNSPGKKAGAGGASSADESRSSQTTTLQQKSQYHSRMPQACPICGQQYNNYNNVLRHMESKHPDQLPQTYKCVKCGNGYPRLSNLREHMMTVHGGDKTRQSGFEYIVNPDNAKNATEANNSTSSAYTGRYDYVMKDLMSITNGGTTVDDDNDAEYEQTPKKIRLETGGNTTSTAKECPICDAVFSNNIGLSNHMRSHTAGGSQSAQAAIAAARARTPNSLTITPTSKQTFHQQQQQAQQLATAQQQAVFKRNLEQAADRRFRRMRCRICQRRFSSKKSYRFHMLNDHQIRNVQFIKCKLCDAEFAYEKGLKVHMFKIHNTLLRDEMIVKQHECDICSVVYHNEKQLMQHKRTWHKGQGNNETLSGGVAQDATDVDTNSADQQSGISTPVSVSGGAQADNSNGGGPLYWYQCKYCPSNFNTNKKLAIHINSHDEFDSNDYSCKDCGNVYSGRKSLWVHRYKKHPQIAEPSECILCKKVFFDSQMLENHIPTCNRKPISATGAHLEGGNQIYRHKTGDDEDDENSNEVEEMSKMKIRLPEVACTMCGQRFTDQELFSKHIQMHEQELYTDNPLASMFDTGPADPNQFYLDCVNDMGEYACDLCSKTFTQMTALKVHRKWHFRGDSKQNQLAEGDGINSSNLQQLTQISHPHQLGLQAVGLMPNNNNNNRLSGAGQALSSAQKRKRELKCEYCPSTFISNNNLRRHMYELHKDEVTNLPKPPPINCDDELHCRRCGLKFETKREWIEHKVADARVTKPFGPFQWGCDLCGEYVSRKEKLINHIQNHLKESVIVKVDDAKYKTTATTSKQQRQLRNSLPNQQQQQQNNEIDDEAETRVKNEAIKTEDHQNRGEEDDEEDSAENDNEGATANVDGQQSGADNDSDDDDDDSDDDDDDSNSDSDNSTQSEADANNADTASGNRLVPKLTIKRNAAPNNSNDDDEDESNDDADSTADDDDDSEDDGQNDNEGDEQVDDADDLIEEVGEYDMEYDVDGGGEHGDGDDTRSSLAADDEGAEVEQKPRFACDLCQVFFDSQQELQKHVKMHFLNGPGSVSLTEIKSRSVSKSNAASTNSDAAALTVTSS